MEYSGVIEHTGVVSKIEGHRITVSFLAQSACGACGAKSLCQISEQKEKEVEITDFSGNFYVGEIVNVFMKKTAGLQAVWYGYFVPFMVMLAALIAGSLLFSREWETGVLAISTVLLYYFVLYLFRKRIAGKFTFYIKKLH